jgi:hypothetical protein
MSATDVDAIIADYLHRLDSALHQIPLSRRRLLVSEIEDHLREARSQLPDQSEASVLNMLDRVGQPEDIAAEAMADEPGRRSGFPHRWLLVGLAGLAVVGLGVGLGVAFAGDSGRTTPTTTTTHSTSVTVPVVTGMTTASAANALTAAGLKVTQTMASSAVVSPGQVISEQPAPGTAVPPGTTVTILVSSGPPAVTLPPVAGTTTASASVHLAGLGLQVTVQQQDSTVVPRGQVIRSEPPARSAVPVGSTITLITSSGPPTAST